MSVNGSSIFLVENIRFKNKECGIPARGRAQIALGKAGRVVLVGSLKFGSGSHLV